METVMNEHSIEVKRWCASCEYKEGENDGTRICTASQVKVPQAFVCPKWQMSDGLQNAGMSGGVVKKLTEVVIE